ncbi:hypothetical protein DPEC_G00138960 [Dallia pectoralis]|uniref:Uncharacterized protein n=1 Tax=Dallia pectoralis TaxID=75939 RepID=A0ACC2GLS1_DALPE|nr:hypothetical protein DPEC_G00138960 [Dallia pectoralis]
MDSTLRSWIWCNKTLSQTITGVDLILSHCNPSQPFHRGDPRVKRDAWCCLGQFAVCVTAFHQSTCCTHCDVGPPGTEDTPWLYPDHILRTPLSSHQVEYSLIHTHEYVECSAGFSLHGYIILVHKATLHYT